MNHPLPTDVTCRCIMATEYPVLTAEMTITECVSALLQHRVLSMPVVDAQGKYLGQFRKVHLLAAVLPAIAVHDPRFDRITRMIDSGLLQETMSDVRALYSVIANDPVSLHLDPEAPVLRPDQPLVAAMFYLFHGHNFLPVVEAETGLLVGEVSSWHVLECITQSP
ncbi:MAG: CBS domain-containing protein [Verrucomicrobiota bacterium]